MFALLYNFYGDQLIKLVLASFFTSVLVLVTVTDFEHRLIPNRAILPAIVDRRAGVAVVVRAGLVSGVGRRRDRLWLLLAGRRGGQSLHRARRDGRGDVKLATFVGLITGFPGIITALVVTIIAGGVISLVLLLTRIVNLRSGIPYGPFICLGGFITMLYGQQIMTRFFFGS